MAVGFNNFPSEFLAGNSKKTGKADGFSNKNSVGRKNDFSPLESPYYSISKQMTDEVEEISVKNLAQPTMSSILQTAKGEIQKISEQLEYLKKLALNASDDSKQIRHAVFYKKIFMAQ